MKKNLLLMGGLVAMLFSSCDQDITNVINLPGGESSNTPATQKEITFTASMDGMNTRAVETTIANLGSFRVSTINSYNTDTLLQNVLFTSSGNGATWIAKDSKVYWKNDGWHTFYAYGPDEPGKEASLEWTEGNSGIKFNFSPNEDAASQKDLVLATADHHAANGDSPVNLVFKHILSEISIKAKNSNADYTVKVSGVELGNIWEKASYYYKEAAWSNWTIKNYSKNYRTTWENPVTLTSEASSLDAANVPFMLIPQQLKAGKNDVTAGNYIAAKITIEKDSQTIFSGWSYTPIDTNWEIGKHYVYTLDFSNGLGKTSGNVDIAVKAITTSVSVTDWVSKDESVSYGKK